MTPQLNDLVAAVKLCTGDYEDKCFFDNTSRIVVQAARAFVASLEKTEAKCEECERLRAGIEALSEKVNDVSVSLIPKCDFEAVNALDAITDQLTALAAPAKATEAK